MVEICCVNTLIIIKLNKVFPDKMVKFLIAKLDYLNYLYSIIIN